MEAGVKVSYPATVIEETDVEKQLFTILYDGYFTLYEFSAYRDHFAKCCFSLKTSTYEILDSKPLPLK